MSKQIEKKASQTATEYELLIGDHSAEAFDETGTPVEDKLMRVTCFIPEYLKRRQPLAVFGENQSVNFPFMYVKNACFIGKRHFKTGEVAEYTREPANVHEGVLGILKKDIGVQWTVDDDEERLELAHLLVDLAKSTKSKAGACIDLNVYREAWENATSSGENIKVYCPENCENKFGIYLNEGQVYTPDISEFGHHNIFKTTRKRVPRS